MDLHSALLQGLSPAKPGDTIWLMEGVYTQPSSQVGDYGVWRCNLYGQQIAPIIVRAVPGDRAILDGQNYTNDPQSGEVLAVLMVHAQYVWFWGFEIMVSNPDRNFYSHPPPNPPMPRRPSGIQEGGNCNLPDPPQGPGGSQGDGCKLINMVLHDCFQGATLQNCGENFEVYGCIVFFNGEWATTGSHGHGIYTKQYPTPDPLVTRPVNDNIVFNQYGLGVNSSDFATPGAVDNIRLTGNVSFNNGLLDDGLSDNIYIGNSLAQVANNCQVLNNYTYYDPTIPLFGGKNRLLDLAGSEATDNYFISKSRGCWTPACPDGERRAVILWEADCDPNMLEFKNNVVYGITDNPDDPCPAQGCRCLDTVAPYRDPPCSDCNNEFYDDVNPLPAEVRVFVRPNLYESGRGHIVVYNWTQPPAAEVSVDVSSILGQGDLYEVLDVQNYFGQPVTTGLYLGGTISIPLPDVNAPLMEPVGGPVGDQLRHTPREFNAFVLRRTGSFPHQNGPGFGE